MNEEAELIISLSATGLGSEGNMETKKNPFHSVGQQGTIRLGRAIGLARMGDHMCIPEG